MKIAFICVVFPPETAPSAVMAQQLAERLVADGHDVTMIVPFPNRPDGVLYPGYRMRLNSRSVAKAGYKLVRCATWLIGKKRTNLNRLLENVTFGLSSTWAAWRNGRPDVMLIESWPLFATQLMVLLARIWRVPYLYYVKDVYPESVEVAGMLNPGGLLSKALRAWDRHLSVHSSRVVVISETMRDLLARNRTLPHERFAVIRDWIDGSAFLAVPRNNAWRKSQNLEEDEFVAMFGGTMGHISGADVLVKAAEILKNERVRIMCVGEGVLKQQMMDDTSALGLGNIDFLPFQPYDRVPEVQGSADVMLLTMCRNHSDASVPSKLISYLAASRPIICAANPDSAVARTVLEAEAGVVVIPGDPEAIARAIVKLKRQPEMAQKMARNARRYFDEHYTIERARRQFAELIEQATAESAAT